jgi:tripartite-type tricarboxylate transporter receptor subunit TctC
MNYRRCLAKLALALFAAVPFSAFAAYPEKPIKLIVPSAPGGAPDVLMRVLAARLSTQMGVPIVVENKPGGSYVIGTMELVRAAPGGYTIGYGNVVSLATMAPRRDKLGNLAAVAGCGARREEES